MTPADALQEGARRVGQNRDEEVGTELADPVYGKCLLLVEVDRGGLEPEPVLGRSGHALPSGRAEHLGQMVFCDGKAGLWKILALAGFLFR